MLTPQSAEKRRGLQGAWGGSVTCQQLGGGQVTSTPPAVPPPACPREPPVFAPVRGSASCPARGANTSRRPPASARARPPHTGRETAAATHPAAPRGAFAWLVKARQGVGCCVLVEGDWGPGGSKAPEGLFLTSAVVPLPSVQEFLNRTCGLRCLYR